MQKYVPLVKQNVMKLEVFRPSKLNYQILRPHQFC